MLLRFVLVLILFSSFGVHLQAEESEDVICFKFVSVEFVNGINTSEREAYLLLDKINSATNVRVNLFYSTHETLFRDLLESDLLKRRELAGYKDLWPMVSDRERLEFQQANQYVVSIAVDPARFNE